MCTGLPRTACPLRLLALCILLSYAAAYFGSAVLFKFSLISEAMETASGSISVISKE